MTPIYIDFTASNTLYQVSNYLDLNTEDPVNLYIEDTDPITNTIERVLAPRYYVLIYSPANQYQATKKINIEKAPHSLNRNQLRVSLQPSIGYGLNACYRVQYWKWHPLLNSTGTISKTKIHEEHWYVPYINQDGYYNPNYYYFERPRPWPYSYAYWNTSTRLVPELYWPYYYNRIETTSFPITERVIDGDYVIDTLKTKSAMSIIKLYNDTDTIQVLSQPNIFKYSQQTRSWTFSKDIYALRIRRLISGVNGINDVAVDETGATIPATTNVKYYLPFHPCDITVKEEYLDQYTI